jgi:nucleotide-binding universal stress UspA family protein
MSEKIVVAYDGSDSAQRAVDLAIARASANGAEVVVAHILEWSPYSFLTPSEIEERHKRRTKELDRAETAILAPVLDRIAKAGVSVSSELRYGHIAETLCTVATENSASEMIIGRTGHSSLSSRIFGSVVGTLAQAAPCAVTIVP